MSSTAAQRLKQATFYLDESIYSRALAERMRTAGTNIKIPGEVFPPGVHDEVWLTECGEHGWIVLMRDQRIRRRPLELAALTEARVAAFVCTAGQATADEIAQVVERLLQKFANMAISEPKPFLFTFGLRGSLSRVRL